LLKKPGNGKEFTLFPFYAVEADDAKDNPWNPALNIAIAAFFDHDWRRWGGE